MTISEMIVHLVKLLADVGDIECECRNSAGDMSNVESIESVPRGEVDAIVIES